MSKLLSNVDLINISKTLGITLNGVSFKDDINVSKNGIADGGYIFNLDGTESSGTHWVCAYKKGKIIIYFDSFGENCFKELKDIANHFKYTVIESMFQLQDLNDDSCGYYCIAFLHWVTKWTKSKLLNSRCLNLFNEMFKTDRTKSNRDILSKYLKKAYMNK
jgi:hypothetical protein